MTDTNTKPMPPRPRAPTRARELHIHDLGPNVKGLRIYKVVISEVFLGRPRNVRTFTVHENHLERLKLRYLREFRIPPQNIFMHEGAPVDAPEAPSPEAPEAA